MATNSDFITRVATFISETTLTSYAWAECIALNLLSTIMGPDRVIIDKMGKLNLNLFFLIIGPSGIAKKTTPIKTYTGEIFRKLSDKLDYQFELPSRYSVEGMIHYLAEKSVGSIIRDEFTSIFKEAQNKDYLADSLEFMSELYDGKIMPRTTLTWKTVPKTYCYVTLLAATTPYLYRVMKPDFFTQGTGNRMLIVVYDTDQVNDKQIDPEDFFQGPKFEAIRDDFIDETVENLAEIRNSNFRYLNPDEDAGRLWSEFELECRKQAKIRFTSNTYDLNYGYLSRLPEMILKLSGLYAVSRSWQSLCLEGCPRDLIIIQEDMKRATEKGWYHYNQFCKMMGQWRLRPEHGLVQSFDEQISLVLDYITVNPAVSLTELRRSVAKWDERTIKEVFKYLHQSDKIKIVKGETSTGRGRKPIQFYPFDAKFSGQELTDWRVIKDWLDL